MSVAALESVAQDIWYRIRDGQNLGVRQGEESLTDHALLCLRRIGTPSIRILKTSKAAEPTSGTDWEWWLGSNAQGWLRFAVQAKRLNVAYYDQFAHKVAGVPQLDILERYAAAHAAIPLYCLFNHVPDPLACTAGWKCCDSLDPEQLGCTVTPLSVVRTAVATWGCRTFRSVHADPRSVPWRCLLKCARYRAAWGVDGVAARALFDVDQVTLHARVPAFWLDDDGTSIIGLPADSYPLAGEGMLPRYVVIMDMPED